jgi:hypothetical protein
MSSAIRSRFNQNARPRLRESSVCAKNFERPRQIYKIMITPVVFRPLHRLSSKSRRRIANRFVLMNTRMWYTWMFRRMWRLSIVELNVWSRNLTMRFVKIRNIGLNNLISGERCSAIKEKQEFKGFAVHEPSIQIEDCQHSTNSSLRNCCTSKSSKALNSQDDQLLREPGFVLFMKCSNAHKLFRWRTLLP